MPQKLTPEIMIAAIAGFEAQKNHIDSQIAEVRSMLDGGSTGSAVTPSEFGKPKRKKFSAASRRKKAESPQAAKPKKRKMSAAGRRAISEATKRRWAAVKAAKQGG